MQECAHGRYRRGRDSAGTQVRHRILMNMRTTAHISSRRQLLVNVLYWLAVVLISVVGTLITDSLTDNFGVSLVTTTITFSVILAVVFAGWYSSEKTLSIIGMSKETEVRPCAFCWPTTR